VFLLEVAATSTTTTTTTMMAMTTQILFTEVLSQETSGK